MAFTSAQILRPKLRRLSWVVSSGSTGAFVRAACLAAVCVVCVSLILPGVEPGAMVIAVLVWLIVSGLAAFVLHRDYPHSRLGLCNHITLMRLTIVCVLTAPLMSGAPPSWSFFALAALALTLDGFDGWLARRQGLASDFGARFDVEVDSLLALTLALNAALNTEISGLALLLGLPRYIFWGASFGFDWMWRPLPERFSRKVVCVVQIGVLVILQAPVLPTDIGTLLVLLASVLVAWSFLVDIFWLWRQRVQHS